MNNFKKRILVTGGAGFIGSHLVRLLVNKYPNYHIVNLDNLTYAGNIDNLNDIKSAKNYSFIKEDICNKVGIESIINEYKIDNIIHLAAESHVDRSITNPIEFVQTNVIGTVVLLNAAKKAWKGNQNNIFYHVSTDEVYGSLGETGFFTEETSYDPRSPYSASKASSDHFVRAYHETYDLAIKISNCSNNYGSHQFPEKLIPLCLLNILTGNPLPIYGDGKQIRDWLYVEDHCRAIELIIDQGERGETYNIGGNSELANIDVVNSLCKIINGKFADTPEMKKYYPNSP